MIWNKFLIKYIFFVVIISKIFSVVGIEILMIFIWNNGFILYKIEIILKVEM